MQMQSRNWSSHPSRRSELIAAIYLFRSEIAIVGVLSMVANVLLLAPTLYMLQVFDRVLISRSELTLLGLSAIAFFLYVVMAFAEWMRSRILVHAGIRLDDRLSARVFSASFDATFEESGLAGANAVRDLMELRQFLTGVGVFAFFDVPWVPIYIGVLFVLHPWLGLMASVFVLIQGGLAWWAHWKTSRPSEVARVSSGGDHFFIQSKLRHSETLESMGMVANLVRQWRQRHNKSLVLGKVAQNMLHQVTAVSRFIRYSQQSLALGMGGLLVIDGQITPGAMIASNLLTSRALAPIDMLVGIWKSFAGARAAFSRLESLLQNYPAKSRAIRQQPPIGTLSLVDVVARVPGRPDAVLKNVSLNASPGTLTVIVGPSGSGKSTLAKVILGIWPDVTGSVLLDGIPIETWDRSDLGPHIGYLPQDVELFEGTIAENIARFNELESEKVIEAAKSTGLHEMILRFPKGYDTSIGEAGRLLSGGQRQRIALARAVYGKPALLMLDEPNSNLDEAGELALIKTIMDLKNKGKTVFLITHRTAAMSENDYLIVMEDGRIKHAGMRDVVVAELQKPLEQSSSQ